MSSRVHPLTGILSADGHWAALVAAALLFAALGCAYIDAFRIMAGGSPPVAPPQLAPPKGEGNYADQPTGAVLTSPDGQPVAQFASPPSDLGQGLSVSFPRGRVEQDPNVVSFAVLASIRYTGNGHTVLVTTARPSVSAVERGVALGDPVRLANGSAAWTRMGIPGDTPNQVAFMRNNLIITVAGDLPISSLEDLATRVVIR